MTTAAEMRNAIMASLTGLAIGRLHGYQRYAQQRSKLRELYLTDDGRINGWHLRRAGFRKTMFSESIFLVRTHWIFTGYMVLEDDAATELQLDVQADLVSDALSRDLTFGLGSWVDDYAQEVESEPVMFCDVLCHQVQIGFYTLHEQLASVGDALDDFITLSTQYDIPPHVVAAQHTKWLQEPADYSASKPDLSQQILIREE